MKKSCLLSVFFFFSLTVLFAQGKRMLDIDPIQSQVGEHVLPTVKFDVFSNFVKTYKFVNAPQSEAKKLKTFNFLDPKLRVSSADDFQVFYPYPIGTYLAGMNLDWSGFVPLIIAPALRELPFIPYSNSQSATYTWTANKGSVDLSAQVNERSEYIFEGLPGRRYSFMPELNGRSGSATATYMFGAYDAKGNPFPNQYIYLSAPILFPITTADIHQGGLYSGWSDDQYFGSGAKDNGKDQTACFTLFQKPLAPLYVEDIDILVITNDKANASSAIPTNKSLTLNVYYLTDEGYIGEKIATTTATTNDITPFSDNSSNVGMVHFSFKEVDDIGVITKKTLLLNKAFIVELTGYDPTFNFSVSLSVATTWGGSAYAVYGDDLVTFNFDNGVNGCDMLMQLNGMYNCLEIESGQNKLEVANAGGDAFFNDGETRYSGSVVYSSLPVSELTAISSDTWLKFERFDDSYYEEYSALVAIISGDPLPAGMTGRSGQVVIASEGITTTIYVKQGDAEWPATGISAPQSVESISVVRQGDDFKLSYPAVATSVSVYNVTGQRVGEYKLNVDGKYTLSTANLTNGIYILKFNGTNQAVKIIK